MNRGHGSRERRSSRKVAPRGQRQREDHGGALFPAGRDDSHRRMRLATLTMHPGENQMNSNATLSNSGVAQRPFRRRMGLCNRRLAIALVPVAMMLAGQNVSTHAARAHFW